MCSPQRGGEPFPADPFEQVAGGPTRERVDDVLRPTRPTQNDDQSLRRGSGHPADRGQTVSGQFELDQADVRLQARRERDRRSGVVRFPHDDEAVRLECRANATAVREVVIRKENRQMLEGGVPPGLTSFYLFSAFGGSCVPKTLPGSEKGLRSRRSEECRP